MSGNEIANAQEIIQHLDSNVRHLDLSNNYVGKVDSTLFDRFDMLFHLKLNNVSLELNDFSELCRQESLVHLDISNNNLVNMSVSIELLIKRFPRATREMMVPYSDFAYREEEIPFEVLLKMMSLTFF